MKTTTLLENISRNLLMAAALFGFSAGDMRATPGTKTGAGENELLSERLASEFPSLKGSLAARGDASYEKAYRTLAGGEVSGLLAHGSLTSAPAGKADAGGMRPALKLEEEAALRSLAEREGKVGAFEAFFPSRYSEPFAVEGGGMSAVLRPLGARPAAAQREKGQIVYRDAYPETDSLHVVGAGRSEEFLYLRNERAPRRFEYELSEVKGAREVKLEGGAIKFAGEKGGGLQIEAPWVVDARGKRLAGAVKWELGEARTDGSRRLSLVVLEGSALAYPAVIDPSWSTTGVLAAARDTHTATLLPNGKVLVAGGYNGSVSLSSAELYDPAAGTWSGTGALATARAGHTATLLTNGKVLVAGGGDSNGNSLSSAELYDPAAGTWSGTGALATARANHTATLLANGKVLVAGGIVNSSGALTSSAELYDPVAGTWSGTGALATVSEYHTATLLANGKVLVAGGYDGNNVLSSAELYDPAAGTWSGTGALATARSAHTATLLPNGKVLVAGGEDISRTSFSSAELYDPVAGTWSVTGALATARYSHTATLLPNGKVLVTGGYNNITFYLGSAELYDPAAGTWSGTDALATARVLHTATLLPNGQVLVAGGYHSGSLSSAELYDPAAGTWSGTGALATARDSHTATLLANGKVLVAGGYVRLGNGNISALSFVELYDPAAGTWSATGALATARGEHTATLLANGKVLVAGGFTDNGGSLGSAELYDPAAGTWSGTGTLATARDAHTATLLPNGKVLVAGGIGSNGNAVGSAELYDPATGTWSATRALATARYYHTATLLPNGKVLVVGGEDNNGNYFSSAELYDPAAGMWSGTGALAMARRHHTATLLPNGKVLVAGGYNGSTLSSAELYDPAAGTWSGTGALAMARLAHTATLLPNGKVLVSAGELYNGNYTYPTIAELYDPAAGTWSGTGALATGRIGHTATLLANGKVLVAGGLNSPTNSLSSAELYDVGLGFISAWQPQTATATSPLTLGSKLILTGSRFQGISQASGGNTQDSSSNYPVVQLLRLDNSQVAFLLVDPAAGWSNTSFTSTPVASFPPGSALATVFTNGIPGTSQYVLVAPPPPLAPSQVVSRKLHSGVPYDIPLPLTGTAGIECRSGGGSNAYQIVFSFPSSVTFSGASASVGSVSSSSGSGTNTATVNLTGITNAQRIAVTLSSVNDGTNTGDVSVIMGVLVGDTNGNGTVNSADIGQTKSQSGNAVSATNFREDVNADGNINASDVGLVKSRSGTALP